MKVVDLSILFEPGLPSDPENLRPRFTFRDHNLGISVMMDTFGCTADVLPETGLCADYWIECSDHNGTHMDSPFHYSPVMDDGTPSMSIDMLPLQDCMGDGVCIHFDDKPNGYRIMVKDLEDYFNKIAYELKPGDIVLLHTGAAKKAGTSEYGITGCGMSREATLWLCEKGVKIVGTDAWSWDRPLPLIAKDYAECKDPSIIWEGHLAGKTMPYFQMEKMNNLDKLPAYGFKIICTPIRIKRGTAGWVRPIAFIPDGKDEYEF